MSCADIVGSVIGIQSFKKEICTKDCNMLKCVNEERGTFGGLDINIFSVAVRGFVKLTAEIATTCTTI